MDDTGDFVVTWASKGQDGSGWGIYAQLFDASGNRLGGEFQVNTTTAGDQTCPSVGMENNGNFLIAWTSNVRTASGTHLRPSVRRERHAPE